MAYLMFYKFHLTHDFVLENSVPDVGLEKYLGGEEIGAPVTKHSGYTFVAVLQER